MAGRVWFRYQNGSHHQLGVERSHDPSHSSEYPHLIKQTSAPLLQPGLHTSLLQYFPLVLRRKGNNCLIFILTSCKLDVLNINCIQLKWRLTAIINSPVLVTNRCSQRKIYRRRVSTEQYLLCKPILSSNPQFHFLNQKILFFAVLYGDVNFRNYFHCLNKSYFIIAFINGCLRDRMGLCIGLWPWSNNASWK